MVKTGKVCPECGHKFPRKRLGWNRRTLAGAKHAHVVEYEKAWPLLSAGKYKPKEKPHENLNQAAVRIIGEATEKD